MDLTCILLALVATFTSSKANKDDVCDTYNLKTVMLRLRQFSTETKDAFDKKDAEVNQLNHSIAELAAKQKQDMVDQRRINGDHNSTIHTLIEEIQMRLNEQRDRITVLEYSLTENEKERHHLVKKINELNLTIVDLQSRRKYQQCVQNSSFPDQGENEDSVLLCVKQISQIDSTYQEFRMSMQAQLRKIETSTEEERRIIRAKLSQLFLNFVELRNSIAEQRSTPGKSDE